MPAPRVTGLGQKRLWRPFDRHVRSTSGSWRLWCTAQVDRGRPRRDIPAFRMDRKFVYRKSTSAAFWKSGNSGGGGL